MKKVDINVKGSSKTGFQVRELDFDALQEFMEKREKVSDPNSLLIQMCLVDSKGEQVFKYQQIAQIKKKLNGVDMSLTLYEINQLNDFSKLANLVEEYQKNSASDQN